MMASGSAAKFVFLTINTGEEFVNACQEVGARGYVWKSRMKTHLIPAIQFCSRKQNLYFSIKFLYVIWNCARWEIWLGISLVATSTRSQLNVGEATVHREADKCRR